MAPSSACAVRSPRWTASALELLLEKTTAPNEQFLRQVSAAKLQKSINIATYA